jgi:glutamate-1-semialdehyde 2,1-aminomutase
MIKGVTPTHVTKGHGPYVWGIDGKKYVDYCCANGTNLFGYAHPAIKQAIEEQMDSGWLYSLGSTMEVECAELVKNFVPFVRKVRFLKSGTEACNSAVRIARAHTGRDTVLSSGYHGWGDDFVSLSAPALGVPNREFIKGNFDFDDIDETVAAVIVEPIITDYGPERTKYLQDLIAKAHSVGALVIFDEVITGFRWPRFTFSAESGIHPDIICLGKACASGLPLSIVGLAEHIGDDKEWFVSSTYAGELLSLAVMKKTFHLLQNKYHIEELWRDGKFFIDDFNAIAPGKIWIDGYPTRGVFKSESPMLKALFFQESHKAGLLFGPSWFYGFQHLGLRDSVIKTCKDILQRITTNQVELEGEMPASPFAEKVRAQ